MYSFKNAISLFVAVIVYFMDGLVYAQTPTSMSSPTPYQSTTPSPLPTRTPTVTISPTPSATMTPINDYYVSCWAGNLDYSFNRTGISDLSFNKISSRSDAVFSNAGRTTVLGTSYNALSQDAGSIDSARYLLNGALDQGYGSNGKASMPLPFAFFDIRASAQQADGKIVIAGSGSKISGEYSFVLLRMTTNGQLDPSFGQNGMVNVGPFSQFVDVTDIKIRSTGKILISGVSFRVWPQSFVAQYLTNGQLDTSFGNLGVVGVDITSAFSKIVLRSNGNLIVVGRSGKVNTFRFQTISQDGTLGSHTELNYMPGFYAEIKAAMERSDGRIVVAATAMNTQIAGGLLDYHTVLFQYQPNGSLDTSFGENGFKVVAHAGNRDIVGDILLQTNGKIIIAGWKCPNSPNGICESYLARFESNGSIDARFGNSGFARLASTWWSERPHGLTFDILGKVVVTGLTDNRFRTARYCTAPN